MEPLKRLWGPRSLHRDDEIFTVAATSCSHQGASPHLFGSVRDAVECCKVQDTVHLAEAVWLVALLLVVALVGARVAVSKAHTALIDDGANGNTALGARRLVCSQRWRAAAGNVALLADVLDAGVVKWFGIHSVEALGNVVRRASGEC